MSKKKVKNKAIVVVANGVLRFKNVVKKQSWFAVNLLQIAMKAKFGIGSNRLHGKTFTLIGYGIQPYYLNLNKGLEHNYNEDDWDEDIDGGVIWHDGPLKLAYSFIADSKKIIEANAYAAGSFLFVWYIFLERVWGGEPAGLGRPHDHIRFIFRLRRAVAPFPSIGAARVPSH